MKARLKNGKIIQGRLAKTFVSRNLAEQIKQGRPKKEDIMESDKLEDIKESKIEISKPKMKKNK